jgi:peptidoglycan hydrolase CwlO-like protein
MQRLACVTFMRRLGSRTAVSAAAYQTSVRFSHDNYVNKVAKKKVEDGDDERWLEAELDENINTPEERYARAREVERLKKLVEALNDKHAESLEAVQEHKSQVEALKKQVAQMQNKIEELSKSDK